MSEAAAAVGFSRLLSDERLTKRAVSGDERAFAAIFRRYHQSLYRFCLAIVGNPEDAQDALQNTMMKVLRALPGEDREIELKPWLYRIAHNESIDLIRRRRETRTLDAEQPAPGYGLAEDAATRERLRRLITDLRNLPDRQRDVLVMRELAGLDFEEIGTALSTSGAVARQTLYEARQSLRQMEEGREMSCESVMKALSDGDGRVTRRRDVRAHLRSCVACSDFRDEIKSRQQEFAALSPLPAIAAAGMLQGLLGGSSAAAGGGLAAVLGGGAAQGIGASAAAKGVATVAVAAAVGVTAADRTGVIHVLPGSGEAKTSKPAPANHSHRADHVYGGSQAEVGKARGLGDEGSAQPGVKGRDIGKSAAGNAGGAGAANGAVADPAPRADVEAGSKGYGPGVQHPSGRGHEKQHPPAAAGGQETAATKKPPLPDPPAAAGGEPPVPVKPTKPTPEVPATPTRPTPDPGPPPNAPTSAPSPSAPAPPQQANPPSPTTQAQAPAAPAPQSAPEAGKGAGKGNGKGS